MEKAFGISVRGLFHRKHHIPNQDYFKFYNCADYTIGVVCDGLGSKKYSQIASKRLSKLVVRSVKKQYRKGNFNPKQLFVAIQDKFKKVIFPFNLKNADTTLQMALLTDKNIFLFKCGDGLIYLANETEELIDTKVDEFSNETLSFGRSKPYNWTFKILKRNSSSPVKIALCTDGISGDLKEGTALEFMNEFVELNKDEIKKELHTWPNIHSSDDKTIIVIK